MARAGMRGVLAAALISILAFTAPAASADPGDIGYQDQSWTGFSASVPPSGSKPESKLWFNDGFWWANMYDTASGDFHIFKLNTATQAWVDTGVLTDDRPNTMSDVLWDGTKLYVASHVFQDSASTTGFQSRLYRYSYTAATDTYTLDAGFGSPFVSINNVKMETLVIDKDSTGQLWATWTEGSPKQTWVNRTVCNPTCDDAVWGTPFQLSTSSLDLDDISSVVAFGTAGDGKIGVMWSDQDLAARVNDKMYFAWHSDSDAVDTNWTTEVALSGTSSADDHINLKADSSGRVFAATKTSLGSAGATLNYLLVRTAAGTWVTHRFGLYQEHHTRAIVVLDTANDLIRMFATQSDTGGTIYEKTLAMSSADIVGADFDLTNLGTPRIRDASALKMNNATSTKQSVSSSTGLVVLATNKKTNVTPTIKDYWHAYDPLTGGDGTPPVFQSAQVDGDTLTMTYDEPLDSNSLPDVTAFTPRANTIPHDVTLVSISGSAVTLTLASPVITGDTVTISYTVPGASLLQDVAGNDAAALTDAPVTNVTGSGPPAPVDLLPNGDGTRSSTIKTNGGGTTNLFAAIDDTIALADDGTTYVKNNNATSGSYFALLTDMPANFGSMATLTIDVRARNLNRIDDNTTLYAQIFQADETTPLSGEVAVAVNPAGWTTISGVSFTGLVPGAKTDWDGARVRLRWEWIQVGAADTSNRLNVTAAELHGTYTTGADTTPPAFVSGQVSGSTLTMSYNEPLDTGSVPAPSAFTPMVNGVARNVAAGGVAIAGSVVTLTLVSPVVSTDTVTIAYTVPGASPIRDLAVPPNNAGSLPDTGVTNNTPGGGSATTLNPLADTYVKSANPTSNFGTAITLQLRDGSSDGSNTSRAYLKFDLSGVAGTITAAKLRISITDTGSADGSVFSTSNDFSTGGSWTEAGLNWNNAPAPGTSLATFPTGASGWIEITLDPSVFTTGGPIFSFALTGANRNGVFFSSKEGSNLPELVLTTS